MLFCFFLVTPATQLIFTGGTFHVTLHQPKCGKYFRLDIQYETDFEAAYQAILVELRYIVNFVGLGGICFLWVFQNKIKIRPSMCSRLCDFNTLGNGRHGK